MEGASRLLAKVDDPVREELPTLEAGVVPVVQRALTDRQKLAQLCFKQTATLQRLGFDSYGRTVANVRCQGADVATVQVRAGLAWVYTPYATAHPELPPLQQVARANGTGLWAQRRPMPPWDYRNRYSRAK